MSFLKRIFGMGGSKASKKGNEDDDSIKIFFEEGSYKSIKKDKEVNCKQICEQCLYIFQRKNKKSEFRIILTLTKTTKTGELIINKRILNNFERIFDGHFLKPLKKLQRKFSMVDVQEYLLRQHYLPTQPNHSHKAVMDMRIEREGMLEMRNIEKKEFRKKHFKLTPEVLIYHEPKDNNKSYQILLLYIEQIYVNERNGDKKEKVCFYLSTSNKTYQIKCKSHLDRNVWIKSLIHFTNLAKESSIIIDLNRRISQIKCYEFETETRNSIFDKSIVLEDKPKMFRSFELLLQKHEKFFNHENSENMGKFFKSVGFMVNELNDAKNLAGDLIKVARKDEIEEDEHEQVKNIREILGNILEFIEREEQVLEDLTSIGWNKLSLNNLKNCEGGSLDETCCAILRFSDDLFYFLQRLSVSQSIFLEEFYKQAENDRLRKLNKFII